ncbi:glutamate synthase large subunit [bacterium]|nr:glutamate synthase large subunit [bacterium]RQV96906.1 MAG: glutamate synthase large subunit [bacterium]
MGFQRNAAGFPEKEGLYDPAFEHESCGIGFVVRIDGIPRHAIVKNGIQILINLEHRGAVGGDKSTGDGAGILVQIPDRFFRKTFQGIVLPDAGHYAVGMVFLPSDSGLAQNCIEIFNHIVQDEGCQVLAWREVPVQHQHLGRLARTTEPCIQQVFIHRKDIDKSLFERKLYVIRRRIEKRISEMQGIDFSQFYIVSLSSQTLIYKGLLTGTQLAHYYPDLQNEHFISAFSMVHQRYSTNTMPTWNLAQPFRFLAHNGEINTLRGNINRMKAREPNMQSRLFGNDIEKIKPVIVEGGSDSAVFDNVLELMVMGGRSLPHAMMMMVPEAFASGIQMSEDKRAFYEFHSAIMEPWDGPAALVFSDGRYVGATLDRNGLRPARYTITKDGMIVMASEAGVLDFPGEQIRNRGRLQPGKMFLVDLQQRRIVPDNEIKAKISRQRPYRRWVRDKSIALRGLFTPSRIPAIDPEQLLRKQHVFGYTDEELRMVISPMASRGQEPIGSMGNDTALAILSHRPQLLYHYFKQLFAQVTNPPIDPLREELVMSLESFLGREKNFLDETPDQYRGLKLSHPILTIRDMMRMRDADHPEIILKDIDILFPAEGNGEALEKALLSIFRKAEQHITDGATLLVLTDQKADEDHVPVPSLLATSGLHHYLLNRGLRTSAGIIVETSEAREIMHFALLIGYGADGICPYLAFQTIRQMAESHLLEKESTPEDAMDNYMTSVKKGLLKTFSRMGISTVHSFFGAQTFEAVGLGSDLVNRYFCGTVSRVEGIGLEEIAREAVERHRQGYPNDRPVQKLLDVGGAYHIRQGGEKHLWSPESIYKFQMATRANDYHVFKEYTHLIDDQSRERVTLRSLFRFKKRKSIPIGEVESVESIVTRFSSAAMSFGSISPETHETIAIAMNRLHAWSNSGEGGEDPQRYILLSNGDNRRSRIKQVASGRFGVTTEYLVNADELQIKIAQGAKPGEGGQLPGHKVSEEIARVRHTTPGVTLISPPPHHDIYSIEDLAQLIYDLKEVNPQARVSVKLVSEVGVGTIATGVAKANADMVLISGHDGGTGASPLTAIKHAGLPWELGLAETHQTLIGNHLRDRICVQVDGQLKTGRDLIIAALLGAEEFGFGSTILVTLGCVMMRKCHLNTCSVGVATQDPKLRSRFAGKPEYVERFLRFIAQELREYMAQLGFRTVDELVGRVDVLDFKPAIEHWKSSRLNLESILHSHTQRKKESLHCLKEKSRNEVTDFHRELAEKVKPAVENKEKVHIEMDIRNVHRTVGAAVSGQIVKKFGAGGLSEDTIQMIFRGSAGQSFGAFLAPGISMRIEGEVNDYMGKGMSGGRIVLVPPRGATFVPCENIICGNVVLYGATGGEVYINGIAGERFAVRNSGALAVVEGLGDHGCEYMTGGIVVVIGPTGKNFAAGMSGGIAYVYDETELFDTKCNLDMVDLESVWNQEDRQQLRSMLENHVRFTGSPRAKMILDSWEARLPLFVKVMPIDYRKALMRIRMKEDRDRITVSATEEVF